jgi:thioredoxin-dependent peroxiredoxin
MAIEEGKAAPAFTLPDQHGKPVGSKDLEGRHVILYFYPKDDTPGCTKEACGFRDAWKEVQKLGAVVLGVSADAAASHQKFIAKYKLPFTLLTDADRSVMERYGAYGEKTMYGKKVMGVIRSTVWIGPDGKVVRHWARVRDAAKHPDEVLEAVRSGTGSAAPGARRS